MDKYEKIKGLFEAAADPAASSAMSDYMRGKFIFYGIAAPKRRALYRDFLKAEKKNGAVDYAFLDRCWADEHREFQYVVFDYLTALESFLTYDDIFVMEKYVRTKQWWDTIDFFDEIIGGIGLRDGRVNGLMLDWSLDGDFWVRRIAIDHQLGRKEKTDAALLEKIIVNNLGSNEFFINKAIGWALRDYSKTNPAWVKDFLSRHGGEMSKLSLREAGKYIR